MSKNQNAEMKVEVEVPIFLRKTYHMIDSCDPEVASWTPDGETFVVKKPDSFEKDIIPQFFKHSKFSSFVRQLNFYGFRKIKYSDNIKIDPLLEAETANYWRFKHEHFVRGRPDLLVHIRRSNSQSTTTAAEKTTKVTASENRPTETVDDLKSEVDILKDRIAKMTSSIDQLTSLVNKINLVENTREDYVTELSHKRKLLKVSDVVCSSIEDSSSESMSQTPMLIAKDEEIENISFTPGIVFPTVPLSRQTSLTSDDGFVNELFQSFDDVAVDFFPDPVLSTITDGNFQQDVSVANSTCSEDVMNFDANERHPNAPDPVLMSRLSDALTILPRDVQELLVNRLIATITASDALKTHIDAAYKCAADGCKNPERRFPICDTSPELTLPLAAATLSALMSQYSSMKTMSCIPTKSLPVIPIHA